MFRAAPGVEPECDTPPRARHARCSCVLGEDVPTIPTSSSYTNVVPPHVVHRPGGVTHTSSTGRPQIRTQPRSCRQTQEEGSRMHCPFCRHTDSRVVDSRVQEE